MFVIEAYLHSRRAKIAAWEEAREVWAASGPYRYKRDYIESHPYPVIRWANVFGVVMPIALVVSVGLVIGSIIYQHNKSEASKPKPAVVAEQKKEEPKPQQKNCAEFNKNDHVRIKSGNLVGLEGVLISGCSESGPYIVHLDKGQKTVEYNQVKDVGDWDVPVGKDNLELAK